MVRLIGIFDHEASNVRKILNQCWDILRSDPDISECLPTQAGITFRKGRSLRDRLVHSHYEPPMQEGTWLQRKPTGMFRCGQCKAHPFIMKMKSFESVVTDENFVIRDYVLE